MKVVFYTDDDSFAEYFSGLTDFQFLLSQSDSKISKFLGNEFSLLFIDKKFINDLSDPSLDKYKLNESIKVIIITEEMSSDELKKSQELFNSFDGYVARPLSKDFIIEVVDDFKEIEAGTNLEQVVIEEEGSLDDEKTQVHRATDEIEISSDVIIENGPSPSTLKSGETTPHEFSYKISEDEMVEADVEARDDNYSVTADIVIPEKIDDSSDEKFVTLGGTTRKTEVKRKAKKEDEIMPDYEDNMVRHQATIRLLREERDELIEKVEELEKDKKIYAKDHLTLKAELEDSKIEISILKKRYDKDLSELKYQANLNEEKKAIYEEKINNYKKEFDRLNQKVKIDFNKVKNREKELESQLELLSVDSDQQVKSRDDKILELTRKIDGLEFNMESVADQEQRSRDDKMKVEEKLDKVVKTLKDSIEIIESDLKL